MNFLHLTRYLHLVFWLILHTLSLSHITYLVELDGKQTYHKTNQYDTYFVYTDKIGNLLLPYVKPSVVSLRQE